MDIAWRRGFVHAGGANLLERAVGFASATRSFSPRARPIPHAPGFSRDDKYDQLQLIGELRNQDTSRHSLYRKARTLTQRAWTWRQCSAMSRPVQIQTRSRVAM